MNKNLWVGVLVAAAAIAGMVLFVTQRRQLTQTRQELAAATVAAEKAKEQATAALKKRLPTEPRSPTSAEESVSATTPSRPSESTPSTGSTNAAGNFMAGLAGMMKDPQMKEMIRTQQKMMFERTYGPLTNYVSLPADRLDRLKDLIADRQMALTEVSMTVLGGGGDVREEAATQVKAVKDEYDKKIKDLLGPTDYETFAQYEQSVGERMQVQLFKEKLPADAALTDQQEYELITAMMEERKALPSSSLLQNKNPDPSQLTEANISEALKQMEQLQTRYAERAGAILTPSQYEKFTQWQQQMRTMQIMGLKMAGQMFGNKPAPPPARQE